MACVGMKAGNARNYELVSRHGAKSFCSCPFIMTKPSGGEQCRNKENAESGDGDLGAWPAKRLCVKLLAALVIRS